MTRPRHLLPVTLVALLGGCAMYDDDVSSYGRYNGVVGVQVGGGYGYSPGWYDGFYYPGSGFWAYDRGGKRHRWRGGRHDGAGQGWAGHGGGGGRPGWSGRHRPDGQAGPDGRPAGFTDGRAHWRGRPGAGDGATPPRRAPDMARPARAAPVERAPSRPTREGRNRAERPD